MYRHCVEGISVDLFNSIKENKSEQYVNVHTTVFPDGAVSAVYIKDLEAIDRKVLEAIVARSYATVTAGTYGLRAREGSHQG